MASNTICHNPVSFSTLMKEFILENKGLFLLYILFLLLIPIRDVGLPHVIGKLYNDVQNKRPFHKTLIIIVIIIIFIQASIILADYVEVQLFPQMQRFIREKLVKTTLEAHKTNYKDVEMGPLTTKMIRLPTVMYNYVDNLKNSIIPSLVTLTVISIYLTMFNKKIGSTLIIILTIFTVIYFNTYRACSKYAKLYDQQFNAINGDVDDIMRNMKTVMSFDKAQDELNYLNDLQNIYIKHSKDTYYCSMKPKFIFIPVTILFIALTLYYIWKRARETKQLGSLITIAIMLFTMMGTIFVIMDSMKDTIFKWGIINNSLTAFETCNPIRVPYSTPARNSKGISFQDVYFSYIANNVKRPIFENLNLTINNNETTLLIGSIGSGKSTLINLIMQYHVPQRGEIFFDGVASSQLNPTDIRKQIMYIPQNPMLFNRSIYENVTYGLSPAPSKEEVKNIFNTLNLSNFLNSLPKGLETNVLVGGSGVSGGQRQIIWLVKTFLHNPKIIIMDEPTAAIDDKTKIIITNLIEKIIPNKTTIMVTHDPSLKKLANRIISFHEGKIVSDTHSSSSSFSASSRSLL